MAKTPIKHDFYQILSLPSPLQRPSTALSKEQIKSAYHKALLRHHPDKANLGQTPSVSVSVSVTTSNNTTYTIDEITTAYKTISDPKLRADYDRSLHLERLSVAERERNGDVSFHTGLEIVDLEDLLYEEGLDEDAGAGGFWYRGCRCGDERGFLVTEQDLEREVEHGEVVVGCRGCSLWMKVLFAVENEGEDQDQTADEAARLAKGKT